LHMAQLMPLPLTVSCFSNIQIDFTFLVSAHPGCSGRRAVKRVCVCVLQAHGCAVPKYLRPLSYRIDRAAVDVLQLCACGYIP